MKKILFAIIALLGTTAWAGESQAPPVVLLELFTSQGCYSCPPAESLVRDVYADRADVVPLEFHVDYWNDLAYGSAGRWADPFSKNDYTQRQIAYNQNLQHTRNVFTPQMIVHGLHQGVGARRGRIDSFIQQAQSRKPEVRFYFFERPDGKRVVRVEGALNGSEKLYYAVYWLRETTVIPSGENKGKTLESRNIVKDITGKAATSRQLIVPAINQQKEGCAVWVQRPFGIVLGAARCPRSDS